MTETVTRFAPSPTGLLHLGHAYSALFANRAARAAEGRFVLRIEDIDTVRSKPEFDDAIIEDLQWLGDGSGFDIGLDWDGTVRRQSGHFDDYKAALNRLQKMGLIYPCFCSRKEIAAEIARSGHAPHGPDGYLYPGTCRAMTETERTDKIAAGIPYVMRLDMARATARTGPLVWHDRKAGDIQATPEVLGDVVLARKDTPTSYHLSVTVDDHLQGITLVTRGVDLFHATHIHRLLQALLQYRVPDYHHHLLLKGADGKRFAKRNKSMTLAALRLDGYTPADVLAMIEALVKE